MPPLSKNHPKFNILYLIVILLSLTFPENCRAAGDLEVVITPSRTQGVAPLSVFFDATGTPSLADGSYLDATFLWNFDKDKTDPGGKYREASGFVAAHVFEKPGTYRVRLTVFAQGQKAYEEVVITALPFSGTTYYVADNGLDTNTGLTMDDPVLTASHALLNLAVPNTRILFRKGDTFYTRYVPASERPGPVVIAGYDDPNSPSDVAPVIYNTGVDNDWATIYIGSDWRIMDLRIRAGGCTAGGLGPRYPGGVGFGNSSHSLIYRLEQDHLSGQWIAPYGQYNTVAECHIHDVSGTGYSSGGDGGAVIGNWVHDKCEDDPEHVFRLQGGSRYFIAFNTFEGNVVNYDALTIRGNTEKVVVYRNQLDRVTGIWPQVRNYYEEYQHHCILDGNLFIGKAHLPNGRQVAVGLHAKDIVIRNNIIYDYGFGISISDDSVVGPSQRIKIYNNTFINMTRDSSFYFVSADPACTDIEVRNNLILDNAGSTPLYTRIIRDRSGGDTFNGTSDYNLYYGSAWAPGMTLFCTLDLTGWQTAFGHDMNSAMLDPQLQSLVIGNAGFAAPLKTSPAIDSGDTVGAVLDYHGNLRDRNPDVGAIEFLRHAAGLPASYLQLLFE